MRRMIGSTRVLDIFEVAVLAGGVIFLAALMIVNIVAREAGHSIIVAEELGKFTMFIITFFGISYAARKARHLRMGAIFDLLSERNKKVMMFITATVTSLLMFYLGYIAVDYTISVQLSGRRSMALVWPWWTFAMWAPLGFFMAGIHYMRTIIKNVKEKETWLSPEEKTEYR